MANFFFFTDIDKLGADTNNTAFGEISATQYRFTDVHEALPTTVNPNAYAVCSGRILVQEVSSALVNIILKPDVQPNGINPAVKFYIYRNILKSSLITGTTIASNTNKYTESLNIKMAALGFTDPNGKKVLGIDLTGTGFGNNDPIDNAFYRQGAADASFQLWSVVGGWSIGQFQGSSFGFEIIMDENGFDPTLQLARIGDNIFTAAALPGSPNPVDYYNEQIDRERILNYIDPCAFFANFINISTHKLFVNNNGNPAIADSSMFTELAPTSIFTLLIAPYFKNKHIVYVDIRNELNSSFDFQWNYGSLSGTTYTRPNLQVSYSDTGVLGPVSYYSMNKWPIWAINGFTGTFSSATFPSKHFLRIAFPSGNNKLPLLHVTVGSLELAAPTANFTALRDDERFFDINIPPLPGTENNIPQTPGIITNVVTLPIQKNAATLAVSSYIHLKYIRQQEQLVFDANEVASIPSTVSGTSLYGLEVIDNVFVPFVVDAASSTTIHDNMPVSWLPAVNEVQSNIYYDRHFIDQSRYSGLATMSYRGIGVEANGDRTLFAVVVEKGGFNANLQESAFPQNVNSNIANPPTETYLENLVRNNSVSLAYQKYVLTVGPNTVPVEIVNNLKIENNVFANSPSELLNIKLTSAQWAAIKTTAQTQSFLKKSKLYLGIKYDSTGIAPANIFNGTILADSRPVRYVRFEIVLRGYIADTTVTPNIPKLIEVNNLNAGQPIYYHNVLSGFDLAAEAVNVGNNARGRTHRIFDNAVPTTTSVVSEQVIECSLNISRGAYLSPEEFKRYFNHFRENIRQIWTTYDPVERPTIAFGNKGTAAPNHGLVSPNVMQGWPINISAYSAKYTDLSSNVQYTHGVEFKLGTARHFGRLLDKEVIVYVNRQTNPRSFVLGNRRGMVMAFEDQPPANTHYGDVSSTNVPAHEFGHVLGLADRYAYIGIASLPVPNATVGAALTEGDLTGLFKVNPNYGRSTFLYLPESYDIDYATRYAWMHNLMSSQTRTPTAAEIAAAAATIPTAYPDDGNLIRFEKDYQTEYDVINLYPEIPVAGRTPLVYQRVSVFITQQQWDIIYNHEHEEHEYEQHFHYTNHVFFKDAGGTGYPSGPNNYQGSFVGKDLLTFPTSINGGIICDDTYKEYEDLANPGASQLAVNGSMKWRVRKWGPSTPPSPLLSIENLTTIRAHIGLFDDYLSSAPTVDFNQAFGYRDSSILYRQQLERGESASGAIGDAISDRRKFFIDQLQNLPAPLDPVNFDVRVIRGSLGNIYLDPDGKSAIIHIMTRRHYDFGRGVAKGDDFSAHGQTGGAKFKLPVHLATVNEYQQGVFPTGNPINTNDIEDAGRMIWNHTHVISSDGDSHYRQYSANVKDIWRETPDAYPGYPKALPGNPPNDIPVHVNGLASLPSPSKVFTIKWESHLNRNIILYLIEQGNFSFPGNNGHDFFRNHRGLDYKRFRDDVALPFFDSNGFNWY